MKRSIHAVAWVLLVVVAVVLWPRAWGGTMTYVVTSGTSMQPMFTAGDVAVLRSAGDYRVGDVVAYRSRELNRVVMHRVLTEDAGVYTFQGDNNDFVDPDRARDEQVLGKLALRVPKVGLVLGWLFKPVNVLLLVGALYLLFSDRRREDPAPPAGGEAIAVTALRVPEGAVLADLAQESDLVALAVRLDRPVLRDQASGESYVYDGSTLYRHQIVPGADPEPLFAAPVDALVPLPPTAHTLPELGCGLDLVKLLRLALRLS